MRGSIDEVLDGKATWCQEHGDCLDLIEAIPDGAIHFCFTDPPYGHNNNDGDLIQALGKAAPNCGAARNTPKLRGVLEEARPILNDGAEANDLYKSLIPKMARVLVKGGNYASCCGGGGGPGTCEFAYWSMWLEEHLTFKNAIIWDKGPMGIGWHYRRSYEFILVATKKGAACRWFDKTGRVENVIRPGQYGIKKVIPSKAEHPTEKPVALPAHFLRLHTQPGDVVLDPFGGSGSTGEACLKMGRRYIGFELDRHWYDYAANRLSGVEKADERSLVPSLAVSRRGFIDIPKKRRGKGAF